MTVVSSNFLLQEANRCVACGLCLPHCPTYRKTESEADSPRGRIALMRGALEGKIPLNARFEQHIGQCLGCRACERVCPSQVAYGQLLDGTRAWMAKQKPVANAGRKFVLDQVLAKPKLLRGSARLLRLAQRTGLQSMLGKLGDVGNLAGWVPDMPAQASWRAVYPAHGKLRGEVSLFLGCVSQVADVSTLQASIHVLNRLGYTVRVPPKQTCCGALHQHGGEAGKARELSERNVRTFGKELPIISTVSGCGAMLAEYGVIRGDADGAAFALQVADVSSFLDQATGWEEVLIEPLSAKIAVHDACSLRNVLRAEQAPYRLLARIPQAEAVPLAGNEQCCGSAGLYALDQPDMASRLMSDKIEAIRVSGVRYVATSNIGCALGMINALKTAGLDVEVLHPVTLLARQMGFKC